jgi:pyruvate/2-oxoglutarate dehydrogenase complex dihydrolipoamide acyltransferase (E2) component
METQTESVEPTAPAAAAPAVKIQTDVREKLAKKSTSEDVFVPTNPAALEKAAGEVAKEKGFDLNRGTSIGARLMARANKSV